VAVNLTNDISVEASS